MVLSAFDDRDSPPVASELAAVLGRSGRAWSKLVAHLEAEYAPLTQRWNFAGERWGWSLRLLRKKRTILYLTPVHRRFHVGFTLGEKAVTKALRAGLPDSVRSAIEAAPRYAEGRGVRFEVRVLADLAAIEAIAAAKMST